jgi:DNA-binding protein HU-beta
MTKTEILGKKSLSEIISKEKKNVSRTQVEEIIGIFLEEIKNSLVSGKEIRFPGYFSLKTSVTKERNSINPKNREQKIKIPAKWAPKFKFSPNLKEEVSKRELK